MTRPGIVRIILTFLIAGPPAGAVAFVSLMLGYEQVAGSEYPARLSWEMLQAIPMIVLVGYLLGLLPALLASFAMALPVRRGWSLRRQLLMAGPVGVLASWLGLSWLILGPPPADGQLWIPVAAYGVTGAIAAVASILIIHWMRPGKGSAP